MMPGHPVRQAALVEIEYLLYQNLIFVCHIKKESNSIRLFGVNWRDILVVFHFGIYLLLKFSFTQMI